MKTIITLLATITAGILLSGCASAQKEPESHVTRTFEENTTRVIESEPVIGQPPARR